MFEVDIHGATLRLPTETGAPYFLQLTFCGGKLIDFLLSTVGLLQLRSAYNSAKGMSSLTVSRSCR